MEERAGGDAHMHTRETGQPEPTSWVHNELHTATVSHELTIPPPACLLTMCKMKEIMSLASQYRECMTSDWAAKGSSARSLPDTGDCRM